MKKILIALISMFVLTPAYAINFDKALVESLYNFSSKNPGRTFAAKMVEEYTFDDILTLEKNAIVRGKVLEVVGPKRAKRNAYFVFKPYTYTVPSKGGIVKRIGHTDIEAKAVGYVPFDKVQAAKSAGLTVAGFFVTGAAQIYHFGKGAITAQKGENRLVEGGKEVYENSPLTYIREGNELHINKGDVIALKFYHYEVPKWKFWDRY